MKLVLSEMLWLQSVSCLDSHFSSIVGLFPVTGVKTLLPWLSDACLHTVHPVSEFTCDIMTTSVQMKQDVIRMLCGKWRLSSGLNSACKHIHTLRSSLIAAACRGKMNLYSHHMMRFYTPVEARILTINSWGSVTWLDTFTPFPQSLSGSNVSTVTSLYPANVCPSVCPVFLLVPFSHFFEETSELQLTGGDVKYLIHSDVPPRSLT